MKKLLITIMALTLTLIMGMSAFGCNTTKAPEETAKNEIVDFLDMDFVSTENISLMATSPLTMAANSVYAEQTLTATVLPASATNKEVDWSIEWGEGQSGVVTDYVTVTPTYDGSTIASVKCYKAFTGTIVITVTTRENLFNAECYVTFVGIPTDLNVTGQFSENSDGYYYFGVGTTYTYNVELYNIFGSVGEDYQDITMEVGGYGAVNLGTYMKYQSGTTEWMSVEEVSLESLKDNFVTASLSGGILSITTVRTIESYYEKYSKIDGGRTSKYTNRFHSYATDVAYFYIYLRQPDTGLEKYIKIKFDGSVVAGVNLLSTVLYF